MKLSKLIAELENVKKEYGDVEVQLQNNPDPGEPIVGYESFFIVPEDYEEERTICNLRTWPY